MSFQEIISQLAQRKYKPVYLLHGSEPFFTDKITDYISNNVLTEAEKGFNQTTFYGKDTEIQNIIETAKRYPMMAEKQVVIVKEAQDLRQIDKLESYMENPVDSTILVFAFKYKKPDGRKKVFKSMKKHGVVFESKTIYENQLEKWIEGYVHDHQRKVTPKATLLIKEYIGSNLSLVANELDKLFISVPEGEQINDNSVSQVIGINKDHNIFELVKTLGSRDYQKAMKIVIHLGNHQKENPYVMLMSPLAKFYSNIILMYFSPKASKQDLSRMLGVNPFFMDDYYTAKANISAQTAVKAIEIIREYDLKGKGVNSAATPPKDLLIELIYKLFNI